MDINLTFVIQGFAFFAVAWLVMKFGWPHIIAAIETRQQKIAEGLAAADNSQKALAQAEEKVNEELKLARTKANEIIDQAHQRANQIIDAASRRETEAAARGAENPRSSRQTRPVKPAQAGLRARGDRCGSCWPRNRCQRPKALLDDWPQR